MSPLRVTTQTRRQITQGAFSNSRGNYGFSTRKNPIFDDYVHNFYIQKKTTNHSGISPIKHSNVTKSNLERALGGNYLYDNINNPLPQINNKKEKTSYGGTGSSSNSSNFRIRDLKDSTAYRLGLQ